jgi:hypothetical protein
MNLLLFPNEIICEIYSHMRIHQRLALRTTCKQLYLMFKQDVPKTKLEEWWDRIINVLGIYFIEKLAVHKQLKFEYRVPSKPEHQTLTHKYETISFKIDESAPQDDNVRISFELHTTNFYLFMNNTKIGTSSLLGLIESTDKYTRNVSLGETYTLYRFKDAPKNQLSESNIQYLCEIIINLFYNFITEPRHRSPKNLKYRAVSRLLRLILDDFEQAVNDVFHCFDNSKIVNSFPTHPENQPSFVYESKVRNLLKDLRKEIKPYFFDGVDAKRAMFKFKQ